MIHKKLIFTLSFLCFLSFQSLAQINVKDSSLSVSIISAHYKLMSPGADMADRFGINSGAGLDWMHKFKNNFVIGAEFSYIFGNNIREESILAGLATEKGYIINQHGQYADVRLYERGFTSYAKIGKMFPVLGPNKNSGILVTVGGGFIQHKVRIETIGNDVPQLSDEYRKGYDRLTNGFAMQEFIGYMHLDNKRLLNFYIGAEFNQGFTQSRRDFNFDTMTKDTQKRRDYLSGIRVGFMFPLYKRVPKEFYYN